MLNCSVRDSTCTLKDLPVKVAIKRSEPVTLYISAYGGDVSGTSGQISSPNYPRQYPHNTEYDWTITVAVGMRVRITFVTMDMEAYNCAYDYVRVSSFYRHK